ncbi:MAG: amino acid permease [Peptococcaceae bacterium]|nr:amino acid permease [Peptococcaceae bacterium]
MSAKSPEWKKTGEPARPQQIRSPDAAGKQLSLLALLSIGLGGAIGPGIFVAIGTSIRLAGPAVLALLLVGGLVTVFVTMMLVEMTVIQSAEGSWSVWADRYLGRWAGFLAGWLYWTAGVLIMTTEVVAASLLTMWWLAQSPLWLFSLIFTLLVTGLNFLDVRTLGGIEVWFAFFKVGILVFFIFLGVMFIAGNHPGILPFWSGRDATGFFPGGWQGTLAALILVMYAYAGIQTIGPSMGDLKDAPTDAPRVVPLLNGPLLILYLAAIAVLINMVRWSNVSVSGSPFVAAFASLHQPVIGGVLNAAILIAVFSALNSIMYGVSRMLTSLAGRGDAPRFLARINRQGVPVPAVAASAACLLLAVVMSYLFPRDIFIYAASAGGVTSMLGWLILGITHLAFRRQEKERLKLRYPGFPFTTWATMIIILAALAGTFLTPRQTVGMFVSLLLLWLYLGIYYAFRHGRSKT